MKSAAFFETDRASRHLTALCHHFGRKVAADCTATAGWVEFSFGRCELSANETHLKLHVSADDQEKLDTMVQVMTSHLDRFAFRENPELVWTNVPEDSSPA